MRPSVSFDRVTIHHKHGKPFSDIDSERKSQALTCEHASESLYVRRIRIDDNRGCVHSLLLIMEGMKEGERKEGKGRGSEKRERKENKG